MSYNHNRAIQVEDQYLGGFNHFLRTLGKDDLAPRDVDGAVDGYKDSSGAALALTFSSTNDRRILNVDHGRRVLERLEAFGHLDAAAERVKIDPRAKRDLLALFVSQDREKLYPTIVDSYEEQIKAQGNPRVSESRLVYNLRKAQEEIDRIKGIRP